jgi:peptidoglycan/LPS O-acetylase OafA/YrhL
MLPWAEIVIGSGVMGGYLAQWGLAGPGHPLILALVAGLIGLTLLAERLPRWARLGLPSIALAFLLIGLAWPYLAGPFDASVGVYVVAVGALVMIAGGLLDRIGLRHEEPNASV